MPFDPRNVLIWIEDDDPGDTDAKELLLRRVRINETIIIPHAIHEATFTFQLPTTRKP